MIHCTIVQQTAEALAYMRRRHAAPSLSFAAIADTQAMDLRPKAFRVGEKSAKVLFTPRGWTSKLPVPRSHVLSAKSGKYCGGDARVNAARPVTPMHVVPREHTHQVAPLTLRIFHRPLQQCCQGSEKLLLARRGRVQHGPARALQCAVAPDDAQFGLRVA